MPRGICYNSLVIFRQIDLILRETVLSDIFILSAMYNMLFSFLRISIICRSSSVNGQRERNRWYSSYEKSNLFNASPPFLLEAGDFNFPFRAFLVLGFTLYFFHSDISHSECLHYYHFRHNSQCHFRHSHRHFQPQYRL